jgi:hypothetical protein
VSLFVIQWKNKNGTSITCSKIISLFLENGAIIINITKAMCINLTIILQQLNDIKYINN